VGVRSPLPKNLHNLPPDSSTTYSILFVYQLHDPYVNAATYSELFKLFCLSIFNKICFSRKHSYICEYVAPHLIVSIVMTITVVTVAVVRQ